MQNESFSPHDGPETPTAETETAKQKFERERLTRRQALKKFGLTSAMTAFALFSVDDLARMVGAAMERQAKNSKIAEQVAKEFQGMGIASAVVYVPDNGCGTYGTKLYCQCCNQQYQNCTNNPSGYGKEYCQLQWTGCSNNNPGGPCLDRPF